MSSGYRSPELNRAIGEPKRSQHMQGRALDLDADVFGGFSNAELFHYIKDNLEFDQMVWEFGDGDNPSWVHVSYVHDGPNRKRCLEAYRDTDGKTAYKVIFDWMPLGLGQAITASDISGNVAVEKSGGRVFFARTRSLCFLDGTGDTFAPGFTAAQKETFFRDSFTISFWGNFNFDQQQLGRLWI